MRVAVPFDAVDPKTRLSPVLDAEERRAFARVLLTDVLDALQHAGREPTVYATADVDADVNADVDADVNADVGADVDVIVDERSLDPLVNGLLDDRSLREDPLAVVMGDLGLVTPDAIERLFDPVVAADRTADLVLAPGRGGGTNALLVREDAFGVDFHGVSLRDHRRIAADAGIERVEVDSMRLSTDVDEPNDLVEVLLHGEGRAPEWLRERGVGVSVEDGRATVVRETTGAGSLGK